MKTYNETDKVLIVGLCVFYIIASIIMYIIARMSFKQGYEDAVKDVYYGKLKCDIVNEQVIWK